MQLRTQTYLIGIAAAAVVALAGDDPDYKPKFHGYFANWAQYHNAPYNYTATDLKGWVTGDPDKPMDYITYSFAFFCPNTTGTKGGDPNGPSPSYWMLDRHLCNESEPMTIVAPEPNDAGDESCRGAFSKCKNFMKDITDLKKVNKDMKVILSIGGWNFPSAYWSQMVSTSAYRAAFIKSAMDYMKVHNFDGIDIDWEYPCSEPRSDPIKMTCEEFNIVRDDGAMEYSKKDTMCTKNSDGDWNYCSGCPDRDNLLSLVTEMRTAFKDDGYLITVASQAGMPKMDGGFHVEEMTKQIDWWNIMSYDYTVSDTPYKNTTGINMPIYNTTAEGVVDKWSVNYTIHGYLNQFKVPPEKMMLGFALYSHTWYVPNPPDGNWKQFGIPAELQMQCCGPFRVTYGAKAGQGCKLCGSMMYSEIMAAGCDTWHDPETQSDIMYCSKDSDDKYTLKGTYISYNSKASYCEMAKILKDNKLAGGFMFDTSMDTIKVNPDDGSHQYTYEVSRMLSRYLHGKDETCKSS